MKKLYFAGIIIMVIVILILALPQIGATCSWITPLGSASPFMALIQAAGLGAILGGLSMKYWTILREPPQEEDTTPEVGAAGQKPPTKIS